MVQVFYQPMYKRYVAPYCSSAYLFKAACYIAMFLVPYFIAYASYDFWMQVGMYREHPVVHNTHDYILVVNGYNADGPFTRFWSTYPEMNDLVGSPMLRPLTSSFINEEDYNLDLRPEIINMNLCMPVAADETVVGFRLMTFFAVNVTNLVRENMASMVFINYDAYSAGSNYQGYGYLKFNQVNPISLKSLRTVYQNPVVNRSQIVGINDILFENYLASNLYQNETLSFVLENQNWKTTVSGIAQSFTISLKFRITEQSISFIPMASEVIKFAYIQYFAIWYILAWLIRKAMKFVYSQQLVQTIVHEDGKNYERLHFHTE